MKSKVYVGEYAAHDDKRRSTQRSAIAEAAYLTSLERNGDVVLMSSYAPLLALRENTNWRPDLMLLLVCRARHKMPWFEHEA